MKRSTTSAERRLRSWSVLVWLAVWQLAAMAVGQKLLIASPIDTLLRWFELIVLADFWRSALFTVGHILLGFVLAVTFGTLLAFLSARFRLLDELFAPLLTAVKSIPVASFVIVALIWIPSKRLSVLISFLIAMPVICSGVTAGLRQIDPKLLEMARVFRMPPVRRLVYIDLPAVLPHFRAAAATAMGLAWKSGVAAEVIGIPTGSIGEKLYKAKVYLATPDLFAWTLTIVLLSAVCERLFRLLTDRFSRRLERM